MRLGLLGLLYSLYALQYGLWAIAHGTHDESEDGDEHLELNARQLSLDQCNFAAQWPPGPGQLFTSQEPNTELRQMLAEIDPNRIEAIITKLVSFGTRSTLSSQTDPVRGIGAARDWIASQMHGFANTSNGRMTITTPSFVQPAGSERIPNDTVITNIMATIKGSTDPNRVYLISGHYDSRVTDVLNAIDDSPGADDDASGVAISMELARILATRNPSATVILAAVAGEEQGLFGSTFMAQQLLEQGADVQGMFTNDIVGSSTADDGTKDPFNVRLFAQGIPSSESASTVATRESIGGENDSPARELGRFSAEVATNDATNMNVRVIYREDRFLRGGDHEPFLDRGFPAARFTEPHENFAHQHQDVRVVDGVQFGDLTEFVDFEFTARVGRVNLATLWSLAQAPGTPRNLTISTSVLTNNSTLTWVPGSDVVDPNLAGFEVLWRPTTEPFWSHIIPVGSVTKTTVLLSKDNVIMGVRAVGKNGFKSPAAYPFPGP
ncbi:hypothetical protein M422DRAFT_30060 [Sphaerobolus stellatus SS14]|uniref:Peptide hydrolase n=1 Tax=Sphaerobolus stellatus (strain SS14) TaxID=990650 RepID=A0A0C9VRY9_SPHS4|nr:hypothetical protein M422DRAFT_30060 [Sphaerobolus stellatus SS14]